MQFDSFYLMRRNDGAVLCPSVMINGGRYSMRGRSSGKDIHNHTFVIAMYGEIHFPAVRRTPMPVEHILPAFPIPVPVYVAPDTVDALDDRFFFLISVYIILVYGKETLNEESGFHQVASIVLLTERLYFSGVTIPPMRVCTVKTVGFLKEGNDTFHPGQSLFAGDIATIYPRKDSHDTKTAATGRDYIGVILGIYPVYMVTFGSQAAIRFRTFPEIKESSPLDSVH